METFGVVRPYEDWMRERVFAFLERLGYALGPGLIVPPGTSDEEAAAWASAAEIDLLLLPYNKHRCDAGPFVDGVGVALLLDAGFAERGVPIVMPVTDFSMQASFDRRLAELTAARPEVSARLVVMPEAEIGSAEIGTRIREAASS